MVPQTKTEKMHLRVTEDFARQVRAFAELDCRSVQDEMRFLMGLGLQVRQGGVQGNEAERRRTTSRDVAEEIFQRNLPLTPATPVAAKRLPSPQRRRA